MIFTVLVASYLRYCGYIFGVFGTFYCNIVRALHSITTSHAVLLATKHHPNIF